MVYNHEVSNERSLAADPLVHFETEFKDNGGGNNKQDKPHKTGLHQEYENENFPNDLVEIEDNSEETDYVGNNLFHHEETQDNSEESNQHSGIDQIHEDFDERVQEKKDQTDIHHSNNHEDFEQSVQEAQNHQATKDKPAIHETDTHEEFDALIQEREDPKDDVVSEKESESVGEFRQEIMNHHAGMHLDNGDETSVPETPVVSTAKTATIAPAPKHTDSNAHAISVLGVYGGLAAVASMVVLVLFARLMARKRRAKRTSRSVFTYISKFDVEDVDVKRAITGGWHGTYKNNLAEGVDSDSETDPGTDDDDEYFVDDEDAVDDVIAGRKSVTRPHSLSNDNTIVFMEQGEGEHSESLFSLHDDYEDSDLSNSDMSDDDGIYFAADEDLFRPVKRRNSALDII
jgi:hypothetical protein